MKRPIRVYIRGYVRRYRNNFFALILSQTLICFIFAAVMIFIVNAGKSNSDAMGMMFSDAGGLDTLGEKVKELFNGETVYDTVMSRFDSEYSSDDATEVFGSSNTVPTVTPVFGRISSPFGYRADPFDNLITFHNGVDIAIPEGTDVLSAMDATVTDTGYDDISGYNITTESKNGFTCTYCHLKKINIKTGDYVAAGEVIAQSGSTGKVTGPHLHFRLTYLGTPVDPSIYFDFEKK